MDDDSNSSGCGCLIFIVVLAIALGWCGCISPEWGRLVLYGLLGMLGIAAVFCGFIVWVVAGRD